MLRKILFPLSLLFFLDTAFAQSPDDALKFSWFIPGGSARYTAIGGAMGSLGGDITANHVNPAGIGLYKTREIVLTPGMMFNNTDNDYLEQKSSTSKNAFSYGTSGAIFGRPNRNTGNWVSSAFSFSVTQLASYNNSTYYRGTNNYSSYSEKYLEELVADGASPIAAENNYIFGSSLAYRTYLVDSVNDASGQFTGYRSLVPIATGVLQERSEQTSGGLHEISIATATNLSDKLYLGISLNIPIMSYNRDLSFSETDISGNTNNNFDHFTYTENYNISGLGINAKLGFIYKFNQFRMGMAFHTPSIMDITDEIRSSITTNTEQYAGELTESSDNLNRGNPGEVSYRVVTPYRVIGSFSYVLSEVADTKRQRGFITADVEFVNYRGIRYSTLPESSGDVVANDYYDSFNDVIKDYYRGNFNFRLGGELKFDPIAIRLGGAYYGSPYSESGIKANRVMLTGGLGYRSHGFFVDLAYAHSVTKDINIPYRLNDKANVFSNEQIRRGNLVLTFGIKI